MVLGSFPLVSKICMIETLIVWGIIALLRVLYEVYVYSKWRKRIEYRYDGKTYEGYAYLEKRNLRTGNISVFGDIDYFYVFSGKYKAMDNGFLYRGVKVTGVTNVIECFGKKIITDCMEDLYFAILRYDIIRSTLSSILFYSVFWFAVFLVATKAILYAVLMVIITVVVLLPYRELFWRLSDE